jgi:ATP-dependent Clp protease protease subunit
MSLKKLPDIKAFKNDLDLEFAPDETVLNRWNSGIKAAREDDTSISIYDVIGEDFYGEGVTAKRIAAALRSIGDREVTVNINSPGGDFFEGIAIYSLLKDHPYKVKVKIMGLAASAASVIAMAGDEIEISQAGFFMIHNAWALAIGNRHDMREAANTLEPFDDSMATLYADKMGITKSQAAEYMDAETWFNADQAIDAGLADSLIASTDVKKDDKDTKALAAIRKVDAALRKCSYTRSQRRNLMAEMKGSMPGAASDVKHDADTIAGLQQLIQTLKK